MKNRIHCIGLDYNETFARGFNLDVVDVDAARAAAGAFLNGGLENRKGVIYGAGTSGALALRLLPEGAATGFLDVAPAKKSFQGLRVEHPAQASWGGFALIAVSPANYLSVMKTIAGLAPEGCDLYFLWKYEFFDPEAWARLHSGDGSRPRVADHRPEGERATTGAGYSSRAAGPSEPSWNRISNSSATWRATPPGWGGSRPTA